MHSMNPAGESDSEKCMLLYFNYCWKLSCIDLKLFYLLFGLSEVPVIHFILIATMHQLQLWFPTCQSAMPIIEFSWQARPGLASLFLP